MYLDGNYFGWWTARPEGSGPGMSDGGWAPVCVRLSDEEEAAEADWSAGVFESEGAEAAGWDEEEEEPAIAMICPSNRRE